jgi:hypothetical protein
MTIPIRILMQTTIPETHDDWHIGRFSLLRDHLASLKDEAGNRLCHVTARNRDSDPGADDPVLSILDRSDFDELWLFAVDVGNSLTAVDCQGIIRFRQRGGGILTARDHQDVGSSLFTLGGVGRAHYFHTRNPDPDESRRTIDDSDTRSVSWPNYHSGRDGDYQIITPVEPLHELLFNPTAPSGVMRYFPAHPHEGAVGVPDGQEQARVIAVGKSRKTGHTFNLAVALERVKDKKGNTLGRGVAEASFHHFADYNWDTEKGAPSFVDELPGDDIKRDPTTLNDIRTYVRNLTVWLAPSPRE